MNKAVNWSQRKTFKHLPFTANLSCGNLIEKIFLFLIRQQALKASVRRDDWYEWANGVEPFPIFDSKCENIVIRRTDCFIFRFSSELQWHQTFTRKYFISLNGHMFYYFFFSSCPQVIDF